MSGRLTALATVLLCGVLVAPALAIEPAAGEPPGHLVISELMTGGASASDEFIELYNPAATALPLEGLELVYVTATGATISRRADWTLGTPVVGPGEHVLVANGSGIFAPIADVVYATGIAASGGSVALRIQGASTAIDAVGWGTAASAWMEGAAASAPPVGSTIERLPGGAAGSGQDTDSNAADFAVSDVPDPQYSTSPPVPDPTATPPASASTTPQVTPSPDETAAATPQPTTGPTPTPAGPTPTPAAPTPTPAAPTPTATPGESVTSIAAARTLADGSSARIRGVALTDSGFTDGGGYVDDGTAAIAVLVTGASFERGDLVEAFGEVDDRFSQRTLRADATDLAVVGSASEPAPMPTTTGAGGESLEGRLAAINGSVLGAPSTLTSGLAFDLDDGSGALRVIVATVTGIDVTDWVTGASVHVVGVLGQRDSTGAGTVGYRLQPRAPSDVISVEPPANPSPTSIASGSSAPSASPSGGQMELMTIAQARAVDRNTRVRVRGVVTLPTGLVDAGSAVIQDASGAILLRLGDQAGGLQVGQHVDVTGKQSTKSGMLSIQVTAPPSVLGTQSSPAAIRRATGSAGEADEARLVVVRGALVANARRASSGSVSFEIDDGSGPLRVFAGASLDLDREGFEAGAWVEATGPLGQETSGSQPTRGYRVWLRTAADVAIVAGTTDAQSTASGSGDGAESSSPRGAASAGGSIGDLLENRLSDAAVSATLVAGSWPELGLAAVAWDGTRIAGIVDDAGARAALVPFLAAHPPPVAVRIVGLERAGVVADVDIALLRLGAGSTIEVTTGPPIRGAADLPRDGEPAWVSIVGRVVADDGTLERDGAGAIALDARCPASPLAEVRGLARIAGIGSADPARLVFACDGVSRGPRLLASRHAAPAPGTADRPSVRAATSGLPPLLAVTGVVALALIGAGTVVAWRRRQSAMAAAASVDGEAVASDGPQLSLVPVRRERGSP